MFKLGLGVAVATAVVLGAARIASGQLPFFPPATPQRGQGGQQQFQQPAPRGPSAQDILRLIIPPPSQPQQRRFDGNQQPQRRFDGNQGNTQRNNQGLGRNIAPGQGFNSPGNTTRAIAPVAPQRLVLTANQASQMSSDALRKLLREAASNLDSDLARLSTGAGWKQHLQLSTLSAALSTELVAVDLAERDRLNFIANLFDAVARNPQYQSVARPWGFQTIRIALPEYALPADVRASRQLAASMKTLDSTLGRMSTGAGWKSYLRLAELATLMAASDGDNVDRAAGMNDILGRFEAIRGNPKYSAVAAMSGFAGTHAALNQLVALSGNIATDSVQLNPQPEPPRKPTAVKQQGAVKLNPQPEPPGKPALGGAKESLQLNPQPEPPGKPAADKQQGAVKLNPQPEPPGVKP